MEQSQKMLKSIFPVFYGDNVIISILAHNERVKASLPSKWNKLKEEKANGLEVLLNEAQLW